MVAKAALLFRVHPILQQAKWARAYWKEQSLILNLYFIRSVVCFHVFSFAPLTSLCVCPSTTNYSQSFHANLCVKTFLSNELPWPQKLDCRDFKTTAFHAFLVFQTLAYKLLLDLHHLLRIPQLSLLNLVFQHLASSLLPRPPQLLQHSRISTVISITLGFTFSPWSHALLGILPFILFAANNNNNNIFISYIKYTNITLASSFCVLSGIVVWRARRTVETLRTMKC